ncbi:MAG: hypothetical protein ABR599_12075, partial [Gemmatimonadota bacterium]
MSGPRPYAIVAALAGVALVLRCIGLGATNLWLDEANTWYVATFPLERLLGDLQRIPGAAFHMPAYFVLLRGWMALAGDSEAAMRALAVLLSVALLPLTYAVGARTLSRDAALLGTLLLALSPAQLFFAQEVRMYAALSLLCTGCALAYLAWWDQPARSARAAGCLAAYAALAALALYVHVTA